MVEQMLGFCMLENDRKAIPIQLWNWNDLKILVVFAKHESGTFPEFHCLVGFILQFKITFHDQIYPAFTFFFFLSFKGESVK